MKDQQINAPVGTVKPSETESMALDVTLGSLLKTAREKMGLSIAETAVKLHLRPFIVENIEADNFTNIASSTYVRGYVKNYARMVGADISLIEDCLTRQVPTVTEPAMQSFSRKTTHQARDTKLKWLSFFIVIVLLGLLVVWWMQKSTLLTRIDVSQPTVEEVAAANQTLPGDVLLTETDVSQRLNDIAVNGSMATDGPVKDTDASTIDTSVVDSNNMGASANENSNNGINNAPNGDALNVNNATVVSVANQAAVSDVVNIQRDPVPSTSIPVNNSPAQEAAIAGQSNINIQLTGDCWINIIDAKGKVLVDGVRGEGANIQTSGQPPFKIILGAPHVASLSVDGQAVSLADFPKGRVARLTIPRV